MDIGDLKTYKYENPGLEIATCCDLFYTTLSNLNILRNDLVGHTDYYSLDQYSFEMYLLRIVKNL